MRSDLYDGEAAVTANGFANDLDLVFVLCRHQSSNVMQPKSASPSLPCLYNLPCMLTICILVHFVITGQCPRDVTERQGTGRVMRGDTGLGAEGKKRRWTDYDGERKWGGTAFGVTVDVQLAAVGI